MYCDEKIKRLNISNVNSYNFNKKEEIQFIKDIVNEQLGSFLANDIKNLRHCVASIEYSARKYGKVEKKYRKLVDIHNNKCTASARNNEKIFYYRNWIEKTVDARILEKQNAST